MDERQKFQLALEDAPRPEDVDVIHSGLQAYNLRRAVPSDYSALTVMVRDADGAVAGGLLGGTFWGWLHVDILWLHERARGQGLGRRLLRLAEDEARRRGCHHVFLDTMSFQALPFYLKQGYSVWGELPDFPIGHTRHFVQKAL
jgi:GNAT superfamily N-acetyltransferase